MKLTIRFLLAFWVTWLPFVAHAQDPTKHPDLPMLIQRYQEIPQIEQLLSKSLEGTIGKVIIVEQEVGEDKAKITEEPIITGRIESISYDRQSQIARIVLYHNITIIQKWKLTHEKWEAYNPDPQIEVNVQKGL